ncbi:MAG: aminotransferase class I/II-fold pyridoxal phosphate-dependent enzyme [Deltaproteobacteria bacterium]|nr:aminotransferase class I/II-fold pyridoxal phosphate-dependent enzyme [Deltaproteobacteria bacterium]
MSKHQHGGLVFTAANSLGIPWTEIIDFSANINPLGQPQGLRKHLFATFPATIHYPEVDARALVDKISALTSLPAKCILPGAGSTPQIRALTRLLDPQRPVIIGPAFAEYEESLSAAGKTPAYALASEEDGFLVGPKTVEEVSRLKPDLLFLANPANPTGRLVPVPTIEALLDLSLAEGVYLVIDEAFINFTFRESIQELVLKYPRLVILRSLTKIFAIPGLRLAYLAAHPDLALKLKNLSEPWPINFMALEAGLFSLPQAKYVLKTPLITQTLRSLLLKVLASFSTPIPSDANFVLTKIWARKDEFLAYLFSEGILVRDCANFKGVGGSYLRFAVRPEAEIARLKDAASFFYA